MKSIPLTIFALIFQCLLINISGQESLFVTESETHIFWQPSRKLTLNDYQGKPRPVDIKYCEEKGACVVPCLGLFLEIDIPKNYRKNKLEKVYFAPAFEKACSYVINNKSDIRDGQLLFDIAEISSRIARKLLRDYHDYMAIQSDSLNFYLIKNNPDTILITGVGTSLASHAKDSAWTFYKEMSQSYIRDMYLSTESHGYQSWRELVDDLLKRFENYATKPEECYRMVKGTPVINNYKQAFK